MHEYGRQLATFHINVTEKFQSFKNDFVNQSKPSLEVVEKFVELIPQFVDFGYHVPAYEVCEELSGKLKEKSYPLLCLKTFVGHMDLAKQRRVAQNKNFFSDLLKESQLYLKGHAHSALGYIALLQRSQDDAFSHFEKARDIFSQGHFEIDSLKAMLRCAMMLRFQNRYQEANDICEHVRERSLQLGVAAFSPYVIAIATLGSNFKELGKHTDALRFLKESAKLSTLLPPTMSTAYAFFQYGNCLEEIGRFDEAILWLKKAEKLQRFVDTVSRVDSLTVLFRAYHKTHQFEASFDTFDLLLKSKSLDVASEILRENIQAAFELYLTLCADEKISSLFDSIFLSQEPVALDVPIAEFQKSIQSKLTQHAEHWKNAKVVSAHETQETVGRCYVDFLTGTVVVQLRSGASMAYKREVFRKDSFFFQILSVLLESRRQGKFGVERDVVFRHIQASCRQPRSLERQFQRALVSLRSLGLLRADVKSQVGLREDFIYTLRDVP